MFTLVRQVTEHFPTSLDDMSIYLALIGLGQAVGSNMLSGWGTIPLWIKLVYTAYVCVLIPVYWRYHGPANFLWFSDIALFATWIGLCLESPLLVSMQAVSVVFLEAVWIVDFLVKLFLRVEVTAISRYMFDRKIPWLVRALSLFHIWLPPLLLWSVYRLGYDRRAWLAQTLLASLILTLCYFFTKPSQNVNWAFGLWGRPQKRVPSALYLVLLMLAFSILIYLPSHLIFLRSAVF
jgi:hypothetical protein